MKSQIAYLDVVGKTYLHIIILIDTHKSLGDQKTIDSNSKTILILKFMNKTSIDIGITCHCPIHSLFSSLFRNLTKEYR